MGYATLVSFLILYQTESQAPTKSGSHIQTHTHTHTHTEAWRLFLLSNPSPGSVSSTERCSSQQGGQSCTGLHGFLPINVPGWQQSTGQKDFDECQTDINPWLTLGLNFTEVRNTRERRKPHSHEFAFACKIAVFSQVPRLLSAAQAKHNHVASEQQLLSQKKSLLPSSTASCGTGITLSLS